MNFSYDLVDGFEVRRTDETTEIVRPCLVTNIPAVNGVITGSDPEVLLKITEDPGCPPIYSYFPTTIARYAGCTLRDFRVRSFQRQNRKAIIDLIYRQKTSPGSDPGSGSPVWSISDLPSISHVETRSTADGADTLFVWYKLNEPTSTVGDAPSGAQFYFPTAHKMKATRVLRATTIMRGQDWLIYRPTIMAARNTVNSTAWGGSESRTWFFPGPGTLTRDYGQSYTITLDFIEDPDGYFPVLAYLDSRGMHPKDCATESDIRGGGFGTSGGGPTKGHMRHKNGITLASIYSEADFASLFSFAP